MRTLLNLLITIFNEFHVAFVELSKSLGYELSDKQLHFIVIGGLFLVIYFFINALFKWLSKYSISMISFIVVFSFAVVVTMAIEVGQYQSGSGQMDFKDVVWGLYGVLFFIVVFQILNKLSKGLLDWYRNKV